VKLVFLLQFANGVLLGVNSVLLVRLLRAFGKLRFPRLYIRLHQLLKRLGIGRYSPPGIRVAFGCRLGKETRATWKRARASAYACRPRSRPCSSRTPKWNCAMARCGEVRA
jgi:hypothetical protein